MLAVGACRRVDERHQSLLVPNSDGALLVGIRAEFCAKWRRRAEQVAVVVGIAAYALQQDSAGYCEHKVVGVCQQVDCG